MCKPYLRVGPKINWKRSDTRLFFFYFIYAHNPIKKACVNFKNKFFLVDIYSGKFSLSKKEKIHNNKELRDTGAAEEL